MRIKGVGSGAGQRRSPAVPGSGHRPPWEGRPALESSGQGCHEGSPTRDAMFTALTSVTQNGNTKVDVMNGAGS